MYSDKIMETWMVCVLLVESSETEHTVVNRQNIIAHFYYNIHKIHLD